MKSVDVIVPCYNYGRYLRSCVGSVLSQPGCAVRVLIIDDASPDGSVLQAKRLAASDPRVQFRAHAMNRGHIATYNEGIDWVSADYMLLLSADDMLAPGALARAVGLMERHPRMTFAYGGAIAFSDETDIAEALAAAAEMPMPSKFRKGEEFIRALCEKPANPIDTATAVVRSAAQKQAGGYRADLPHAGDYEMWLRLALLGDVGVIDGLQAFTRIHANNMRHGYSGERQMGDYQQRHLTLQIFFEAAGGQLDNAHALRQVAMRQLADEVLWAATSALENGRPALAQAMAELAVTIDPGIRRAPAGLRFALKRRMGPTWLKRMQRLAGRSPSAMAPDRLGAS